MELFFAAISIDKRFIQLVARPKFLCVADKKFYSLHFGVDACVEERLPCKGVSSNRPAWWQAWHVGIDSAVEARSILLLVPFVEKLAQILRPHHQNQLVENPGLLLHLFAWTSPPANVMCLFIFVRSSVVLSR